MPCPQVYNDAETGRIKSMECDMALASRSMLVVVRGRGPVGQFVATVSNMSLRGGGLTTAPCLVLCCQLV